VTNTFIILIPLLLILMVTFYDVDRGILAAIDVLGDNALVGVRFICIHIWTNFCRNIFTRKKNKKKKM